jgi:hypothetical protein
VMFNTSPYTHMMCLGVDKVTADHFSSFGRAGGRRASAGERAGGRSGRELQNGGADSRNRRFLFGEFEI